MRIPSYRWSCHGCGAVSEPGIATCASCGLSASATGEQIVAAKASVTGGTPPTPVRKDAHWLFAGGSFILFFPEGFAAALIFLASPGWLLSLLYHGHLIAAGVLASGMAGAGAVAYIALRERSRGLLYVSVVLSIAVALWVNSLSRSVYPNAA